MDSHLRPAPPIPSELVDAILQGGPQMFPRDLRRARVQRTDDKVKVPHYGGYEHFERDGTVNEDGLAVFSWTGRTRVAE